MRLENEFVPLTEARNIGTGNVMRARLISPGWGSSGYYSRAVLEKAAGLYKKGVKMYANHPTRTEQRERPERSINDIAGYLESNAKFETSPEPGIYANIRILPRYLDLVRNAASVIGLSHFADGTTKPGTAEGRQGSIIEAITNVFSVDIVTEPGRGGSFLAESLIRNVPAPGSLEDAKLKLIESYIESGMKRETAIEIVSRL